MVSKVFQMCCIVHVKFKEHDLLDYDSELIKTAWLNFNIRPARRSQYPQQVSLKGGIPKMWHIFKVKFLKTRIAI